MALEEADQLIFEEASGVRKMILNMPKKLNTLSYKMVRKIYEKSRDCENDPMAKLVILKANGKVFSSGGDIVSAYIVENLGHWSLIMAYYRKVYCLVYLHGTYKKSLLAILDGRVIGGGAGISINSTFRIVTENTIFTMPEGSIGLFPDVGASYFLARLPGFFGEYIGLTGVHLNGAEMLAFGLGTHFIPSKELKSLEIALEKTIASLDSPSVATITMIINKFAQEVKVKDDSTYYRLDMINQCFSGESCEEILSSLESLATQVQEKWVHEAIRSMKAAYPLGLKIFLRTIREGRHKSFEQCLHTEYIALSHVIGRKISNDFYEGTKALMIEKDKKPQWVPSTLEEVSEEMVTRCLTGTFSEDDDWLPLQLPSGTSRNFVVASKL